MDLVLETLDHYVFDDVYAKIAPVELQRVIDPKWADVLSLNKMSSNGTVLAETLKLTNSLPRVNKDVYGLTPFLFDFTEATYKSLLPRNNLVREFFSLWAIATVFGMLLYLIAATLSYFFVFDKNIFNHPRYLKNQMKLEIRLAIGAIPVMSLLTVPWFMLELNGYSRLYYDVDWENHGLRKLLLEYATFIFFTDCGIYLAHRWLHWPRVYKALHKPHHKWLVCTPFASHAFHPVDGYFQSLSYHIYPMILPLHKVSYLILFTFVNFWSVMIHDGQHMSNNPVVNGTACHTVHHLYFNYNFGQFTTLWDRLGGSYRKPEDSLFDPKLKSDKKVWEQQAKEAAEYIKEVEGEDNEREYINDSKKTN